jgi:tetratricopeptide (TPR) repeat protein
VLYGLGFYGKAAETYIAGLERQPEHPAGFFVLGNCYFRTEDYAAAALSYRQALAQEPNHDEARHNLEMAEEMLAKAA